MMRARERKLREIFHSEREKEKSFWLRHAQAQQLTKRSHQKQHRERGEEKGIFIFKVSCILDAFASSSIAKLPSQHQIYHFIFSIEKEKFLTFLKGNLGNRPLTEKGRTFFSRFTQSRRKITETKALLNNSIHLLLVNGEKEEREGKLRFHFLLSSLYADLHETKKRLQIRFILTSLKVKLEEEREKNFSSHSFSIKKGIVYTEEFFMVCAWLYTLHYLYIHTHIYFSLALLVDEAKKKIVTLEAIRKSGSEIEKK